MDILPVSGWQVIQNADDTLIVLLSGAHDDLREDDLTNTLMQALTGQGVQDPAVRIQNVSTIPKTSAGKAPLIKAYNRVRS
jgi:hypothetical protein